VSLRQPEQIQLILQRRQTVALTGQRVTVNLCRRGASSTAPSVLGAGSEGVQAAAWVCRDARAPCGDSGDGGSALHGPDTGAGGREVGAGALCSSDSNKRVFEMLREENQVLLYLISEAATDLWGSAALALGSSSYLQFKKEEESTLEE